MSPFQILSAIKTHIRGRFQIKLSYQIGGALIDLALKSDDVQTLLQKEQPGL